MKRKLNNLLIHGHVLDALDTLKANSVQSVVTSPPYWGMRRYKKGIAQHWSDGLQMPFVAEPTPEQYTLSVSLRKYLLGHCWVCPMGARYSPELCPA